jgi:hypothetical protein
MAHGKSAEGAVSAYTGEAAISAAAVIIHLSISVVPLFPTAQTRASVHV